MEDYFSPPTWQYRAEQLRICEEQSRGLTTSDGAIIDTDQVIISLSASTGDLHQGKYEEPSRSLKPVEKCQGTNEEHSTSPNNNDYTVTEQFQFQQAGIELGLNQAETVSLELPN